jgi:hypothetical protein
VLLTPILGVVVLEPELLCAETGGKPFDDLDDLDPLSFPQLLAVIVIDDLLAYDRLLVDPLKGGWQR